MRLRIAVCSWCMLLLEMGARPAWSQILSQTTSLPIAQTTSDTLRAMSRQAGVIFAGQVLAVRRKDGFNGATGVVEIDFAVDDAIRGVHGGAYTLREWAALWTSGDEPFRVGQRYLMLLHRPSHAGLSSPIGGTDGAIPIRGSDAAQVDVNSAQVQERRVDLRWIATHGTRTQSYQPDSVASPILQSATAHSNVVVARLPVCGESAEPLTLAAEVNTIPTPQGDSYTSVLAILRSWERVDHATR